MPLRDAITPFTRHFAISPLPLLLPFSSEPPASPAVYAASFMRFDDLRHC
jgi:hypothetical protein